MCGFFVKSSKKHVFTKFLIEVEVEVCKLISFDLGLITHWH